MAKEYKDIILEVYKVESEKYNNTREIHWQINFGIWTFLALAIYAKINGNLPWDSYSLFSRILVIIIFGFLDCFFLSVVHSSLDNSLNRMKKIARNIFNNSEQLLAWDGLEKKDSGEGRNTSSWKWRIFQFGISALLIVLLCVVQTKK